MPDQPVLALDGASLTCDDVAAVARGLTQVALSAEGRQRAGAAAEVAAYATARREVYGRTTGVGANRGLTVGSGDEAGHGLRLVRSHAGGGGPLIAAELGRAMLVVRVNQIAVGGSGVDPGALDALVEAINGGLSVPVPVWGAIGTGDLTALAVTALCLLGERDWVPQPASPPRFALASPDALAFLSSNAATIGEAALACSDLAELLQAAIVVAAFSHLAVDASAEPYAAPVHAARPHPGQQAVAAAMRELLAAGGGPAPRVQDPYGYRALPQVHGPAVDAAGHATQIVTSELNAAAENPLIDVAGQAVWHNGNFHTAYIGLALDALRAALFQTSALSAARLGTLVEPAFTGLAPFLATDPPPSSGVMILEYVAQSAIADIRRLAAPAALGSAVLSRGVEEHAGFSTQSARATTEAVPAYRIVLACELVAAIRALRLRGIEPSAPASSAPASSAPASSAPASSAPAPAGPMLAGPVPAGPVPAGPGVTGPVTAGLAMAGPSLAQAFRQAADALPADTSDRPLDGDLAIAQLLLPALAALAPRPRRRHG